MHAMGNDFVVTGTPSATASISAETVKKLCDRHYGVGADCLVLLQKSSNADFFMRVFNPDGFEAEICGNALRCAAKYVCENGYTVKKSLCIETLAGIRTVKIDKNLITTEIGRPRILKTDELSACGITIPYTFVNIGNPHCVIFTDSLGDAEFSYLAPIIEKHECFPEGTNVEFVSLISEDEICMRVWERGLGETLSCTTGSCACVAVALSVGKCRHNTNVRQKGGTIRVNVLECGNVFVTAECTTVFNGDFLG